MDIRSFYRATMPFKTETKTDAEWDAQKNEWCRVLRTDGPTWKMTVEETGDYEYRYTLYQWKAGAWVSIDSQGAEGDCDGWHVANFNLPGLVGELRVSCQDGEVGAAVLFTDENDDGPCLYFTDGTAIVEMGK